MYGSLFLIPTPLEDEGLFPNIPSRTHDIAASLDIFIVEDPKVGRAFLKRLVPTRSVQMIEILVLNEHSTLTEINALLNPLKQGRNVGLISDAGCPAVADPGANLIRLAHENAVPVIPLVGPSSILLALMASGLNGQKFYFHGYLPAKTSERNKALRTLEKQSRLEGMTQIFIETPYRNGKLLDAILANCEPNTLLCLATDITLITEEIKTRTIYQWQKNLPQLEDRPTVFLLYVSNMLPIPNSINRSRFG